MKLDTEAQQCAFGSKRDSLFGGSKIHFGVLFLGRYCVRITREEGRENVHAPLSSRGFGIISFGRS